MSIKKKPTVTSLKREIKQWTDFYGKLQIENADLKAELHIIRKGLKTHVYHIKFKYRLKVTDPESIDSKNVYAVNLDHAIYKCENGRFKLPGYYDRGYLFHSITILDVQIKA